MNQQKQLIDNACRLAVMSENNKFTKEQRTELFSLLDDVQKVNILNVWKYKKSMDKFEDAFRKYGGNVKALEEDLIKIRNQVIQLFKTKQEIIK